MSRRLLILGWHNVEATWAFPSRPGAGTRGLRKQLTFLRRVATVVELDRALDDLAEGRSLPPRAVALTFDDGYRDNLDTAVPMLKQLGLPATFFLVPEVLDGGITPWWESLSHAFAVTSRDSLAWGGTVWPLEEPTRRVSLDEITSRLKRLRQDERMAAVAEIVDRLAPESRDEVSELFLDWEGARELTRRGATIGAHSNDHAILANESPETQARNLREARQALETGLGHAIDLLAYPNGTRSDFDAATVDAASAAGYRCGVTTISGWNSADTDVFELRRQVVHPELGVLGFKPVVRQSLVELRRRWPRT
jgi:peptidoglycan/xylan/chitin deacetylase (PgdA/CDA1 family)